MQLGEIIGNPENAHSEMFNSRLPDELLDREWFTTVPKARALSETHKPQCNHHRPHSSLDCLIAAAFAAGGAAAARRLL